MTASVEKSIDIDVPLHVAYDQWMHFELFPEFMEGVVAVQQLSDTKLHWKVEVAGREKEWDAQIIEQHPDQRIAWKAIDGVPNAGVVTFHRISDTTTRVMLQLEAEPEGLLETVGDKLGVFARRVEDDLKRFKEFVESSGGGSVDVRGEIEHPSTRPLSPAPGEG